MRMSRKCLPEMLPYAAMNRENALRLAADERFAEMLDQKNRKHNKERLGRK